MHFFSTINSLLPILSEELQRPNDNYCVSVLFFVCLFVLLLKLLFLSKLVWPEAPQLYTNLNFTFLFGGTLPNTRLTQGVTEYRCRPQVGGNELTASLKQKSKLKKNYIRQELNRLSPHDVMVCGSTEATMRRSC